MPKDRLLTEKEVAAFVLRLESHYRVVKSNHDALRTRMISEPIKWGDVTTLASVSDEMEACHNAKHYTLLFRAYVEN